MVVSARACCFLKHMPVIFMDLKSLPNNTATTVTSKRFFPAKYDEKFCQQLVAYHYYYISQMCHLVIVINVSTAFSKNMKS